MITTSNCDEEMSKISGYVPNYAQMTQWRQGPVERRREISPFNGDEMVRPPVVLPASFKAVCFLTSILSQFFRALYLNNAKKRHWSTAEKPPKLEAESRSPFSISCLSDGRDGGKRPACPLGPFQTKFVSQFSCTEIGSMEQEWKKPTITHQGALCQEKFLSV